MPHPPQMSPERCRDRNLPRVPEQSATAELFRQRWWQHWRMSLSILRGFKMGPKWVQMFQGCLTLLECATLSASVCHRETSMLSDSVASGSKKNLSIAGKGLVSQFLGQHNVKQSQSKLPFPCFPGQLQTKNETFSWFFAGPILSIVRRHSSWR